MKKINFLTHLAAAAIVTIMLAFIYITVQQTYCSGANDPQLEIARNMSHRLKQGISIDKWMQDDTVEISQSLSVFKILFNEKGEPLQSTGVLDGQTLHFPKGVFDFADKNGENDFSWQPQTGVRAAVVLERVLSNAYSFVAVGRSLKEVELREEKLLWTTLVSWLFCVGTIMFHWLIMFFRTRIN
jgi:hypothetical protein